MGGRGGSSGMSGGGRSGNSVSFSQQASRIANPSSKQDFIERAEFIGNVSENAAYKYDVSTSDWQNYGKDRTYIKLNQYNASDGSLRQSMDMGYYDNIKNQYIEGRGKNSDSMTGNLWDIQGSQKYSETDIADFLKKKKK